MDFRRNIFALLALAAALAGCDDRSAPEVAAPPPPVAPVAVSHPATLTGRVTFAGAPPRLSRLPVTGDAHCTAAHPDGLPDESVVVAPDGGLANVFVYLKDAPRAGAAGDRPPGLIDQVNCQYVPHAVAVQVGQPLRVKSSDPVLHNVHILGERNPPTNLSETHPGEKTVRFEQAEFLRFRCDVHQWMKAVVGVFDTPYFAVTAADGKYVIPNVPPGTYTLAAWHERFGELTRKVSVAPDGTVREDFGYKP